MGYSARAVAPVRDRVLLVSAVAWILLLGWPGSMVTVAHCPVTSSGGTPFPASFQMVLAMNPPSAMAAGWAVMLVAMMSPVLIPPLSHVWQSSFTSRRARSMALFVSGYAVIWMALGVVLLATELVLALLTPQPYLAAASLAIIALIWQFSPIKQRCLNRCCAHAELAVFGAAADFDALRFGITHGVWCAGSCWALMLVPMLLTRGHMVAMAVVSVLIFSERLEQPMPPCWRPRGLGKMKRIVTAQARIRLHALRSA